MSDARKSFFRDLAPSPDRPLGVDPAIPSVVATYLSEAIVNSSRSALAEISDDITVLFQESIKIAPDVVIDAVFDENDLGSVRSAFILGQFSFAQLISGALLSRRMDDSGADVFLDSVSRKYLCFLYHADSTNTELSEITGQRVETVSRRLKKLRELGLVDFRREGVTVINFLTPFARLTLEKEQADGGVEKVTANVKKKLNIASKDVAGHMKSFVGFGRKAL